MGLFKQPDEDTIIGLCDTHLSQLPDEKCTLLGESRGYNNKIIQLFTRKTDCKEFDIFTELEFFLFANDTLDVTFSHQNLLFPSTSLVAGLVRKMVIQIGKDDDGKGYLKESEENEIQDRSWAGRSWQKKAVLPVAIYIDQEDDNFAGNLCLDIQRISKKVI